MVGKQKYLSTWHTEDWCSETEIETSVEVTWGTLNTIWKVLCYTVGPK